MIQSKPPVTRWYNNLSLAGKTTCMDKIASNSNSIFARSAGFSLSGSQIRMLVRVSGSAESSTGYGRFSSL